jgi:divalent metal cation (Fe/Co/Zn/Cd) transporter
MSKLLAEYSRRYGISFHAIRTRQAGARRFITFHMLVSGCMDGAQAHHLSEELESRIRSLVPNATVLTHIEPISDPAFLRRPGTRLVEGST